MPTERNHVLHAALFLITLILMGCNTGCGRGLSLNMPSEGIGPELWAVTAQRGRIGDGTISVRGAIEGDLTVTDDTPPRSTPLEAPWGFKRSVEIEVRDGKFYIWFGPGYCAKGEKTLEETWVLAKRLFLSEATAALEIQINGKIADPRFDFLKTELRRSSWNTTVVPTENPIRDEK